jgi:hypothetical protein
LSDDEIRIFWNRLPEVFKRSINVQRIPQLCSITGQRNILPILAPPPLRWEAVFAGLTARSAYPFYPDPGGRLPMFHDEPELLGGPFREAKDVRDGADGVRHE